jgi:hypothetical protein
MGRWSARGRRGSAWTTAGCAGAVDGLTRTLGGGRGVLVPPEDPGALAETLSRVLGGERPDPVPGRVYARQFTPGAAAAVYAAAYRQLLASRGNSGRASAAPP